MMIKLEIKDFYSPDIDKVWEWEPKDNQNVNFLLEINIGVVDEDSSDIFQVIIATPKGLNANINGSESLLIDRACLVFSEYSWENVINKVSEILVLCSADNWKESTTKLQRYFHWEYEDYVEE